MRFVTKFKAVSDYMQITRLVSETWDDITFNNMFFFISAEMPTISILVESFQILSFHSFIPTDWHYYLQASRICVLNASIMHNRYKMTSASGKRKSLKLNCDSISNWQKSQKYRVVGSASLKPQNNSKLSKITVVNFQICCRPVV